MNMNIRDFFPEFSNGDNKRRIEDNFDLQSSSTLYITPHENTEKKCKYKGQKKKCNSKNNLCLTKTDLEILNQIGDSTLEEIEEFCPEIIEQEGFIELDGNEFDSDEDDNEASFGSVRILY